MLLRLCIAITLAFQELETLTNHSYVLFNDLGFLLLQLFFHANFSQHLRLGLLFNKTDVVSVVSSHGLDLIRIFLHLLGNADWSLVFVLFHPLCFFLVHSLFYDGHVGQF